MGIMQGREEHRGKGVREGGREEAHHSSVSIAYHTL